MSKNSLLCVILKRSALRVRADKGNCVSKCKVVRVNEQSEERESIGNETVELYRVKLH